MSVALSSRSRLLMVNSRVTVLPGGTGSSVKDLTSERGSTVTSRTALAFPLDTVGLPLLSSPVVLPSMPAPVAMTSTLIVQLEPAPTEALPP
jgi:hypothetical protein